MLELFILEDCPYCQKVLKEFNNNNIKFKKYDILNKENTLRLLSLGGKDQVPFLYNNTTKDKIYESEEIIKYIHKNFRKDNDTKQ